LSSKVFLAVNVLKFLAEGGDRFVTTSELFKKFVVCGLLEDTIADRKRLQRILSELAEIGFVLKKYKKIKGKRPQEWKINFSSFPYFLSCSEEEILSLLVLTSFIPRKYRNVSVLQPALKAMNRLGRLLDEEKRKIAMESFDYLPVPVERYSVIDKTTLENVFNAILERRKLLISYKSFTLEVYPIKVFNYNGVFYLSAIEAKSHRYMTLKLVSIKVHKIDKEQFPAFFQKKYKNKFFAFPEKPFVLKVELPADYMSHLRVEHNVLHYPTQFHMEFDNEKVLVWLVGFASYRFASWMVLDEIKMFYMPNEQDIMLAKRLGVYRVYEDFTLSITENRRRFKKFLLEIRRFLKKRKHLMDIYLSDF
jgi:predicted DNA-binding transcriptional regulator YafY